ncbi:hypothetical protein, partial [Streptococcus suis]|uniref:hypothetical protein n=1 Tax=Streptococcus suis TaxID=1307 RepID=UPI0005CD49E0
LRGSQNIGSLEPTARKKESMGAFFLGCKPTCLAMSNDSLLTLNTYLIKNEIISIITSVE